MKRSAWMIPVAALLVVVATARLGWWQLDRAAQKTQWAAEQLARGAWPALQEDALAKDLSEVPSQTHRRVRLEGQWQTAWTVFLENRPMNGRTGFYVLTPLTLRDGSSVLIQRGWQPRDMTDRTKVMDPPTPQGVVWVQGRVIPSASRVFELPGGSSAQEGRIRQNLDLVAFAREARLTLLPLAILQEASEHEDGLLRDWPVPSSDIHKHYGYAFQWFALCALTIGLYVWFQIIRPRRRAR
ncbi:MAG: hypothetical protein RI949_2323 [Pseudomonadota bacterium]